MNYNTRDFGGYGSGAKSLAVGLLFLWVGMFIGTEARGQSIAVVNAINYQAEVTPGAFAAAFSGEQITALTVSAPAGELELGGVRAELDGQPATLFFVSPFQVNLRVPAGAEPGQRTLTLHGPMGQTFTGTVTVLAHAPRLATNVGTNNAAAFFFDVGPIFGIFFASGIAVRIDTTQQTGTATLIFNDGRQFNASYAGPSALPFGTFQQLNFGFVPGDLDGEPMARLRVCPDGGVCKDSNVVTLKR